VRKWHRALRAKAAVFPEHYDFADALRLDTVGGLTEVFVREHTDYEEVARYLAAYTLTGTALEGVHATIVAALDDPIIPSAGLSELPASIEVVPVPRGGHCGFIDTLRGPSWIDRYAADFFCHALR
jgi:predicted alpha/beta-fold hydrolase